MKIKIIKKRAINLSCANGEWRVVNLGDIVEVPELVGKRAIANGDAEQTTEDAAPKPAPKKRGRPKKKATPEVTAEPVEPEVTADEDAD